MGYVPHSGAVLNVYRSDSAGVHKMTAEQEIEELKARVEELEAENAVYVNKILELLAENK